MDPVLVLDNGGATIKVGLAHDDREPRIVSNAVVKPKGSGARLFIGHEIEECHDFFGLYYRRPFEKGILCDWDTEKAVWDKLFSSDGINIETKSHSLLVTEPYFNLPSVQETYDQMVFEEYEFKSYLRCPSASTILFSDLFSRPNLPSPQCFLLVESGFSFTHVVPVMNGAIVWSSVRRIDVGGKLLTNHLKELVSFRHWDVMEHTYVMNQVKEACCYVSSSFSQDLEICQVDTRRNSIVQEYVLPDFSINRKGYIKKGPGSIKLPPPVLSDSNGDAEMQDVPAVQEDLPILYMSNERFTVPEVLFHPSDIGLDQCGLPETILDSISSLPGDIRGLFWANIALVGGNFNIPGIEERLRTDLRALAPPEIDIMFYRSDNPVTEVYRSARAFARSPSFVSSVVTREEYLEGGPNACRRKFTARENGGFGIEKAGRDREEVEKEVEDARMPGAKSKGTRTRGAATVEIPKKKDAPVARRKSRRG